MEVKEHFDSDITVLLNDKQRLQEQLESERLCTRQLERDLEALRQLKGETMKTNDAESVKQIEQLPMEKEQLESSLDELRKQNQALEHDLLQEKKQCNDLNLLISNQQLNISSLNEDLSSLRETFAGLRTLIPDVESANVVEHVQQVFDHLRETQEQVNQLTNELKLSKERWSNDNDEQIQTLKSDYDRRILDLNNRIEQLQEVNDDLQQSLNAATEQCAEYKRNYKQAQESTGECN